MRGKSTATQERSGSALLVLRRLVALVTHTALEFAKEEDVPLRDANEVDQASVAYREPYEPRLTTNEDDVTAVWGAQLLTLPAAPAVSSLSSLVAFVSVSTLKTVFLFLLDSGCRPLNRICRPLLRTSAIEAREITRLPSRRRRNGLR